MESGRQACLAGEDFRFFGHGEAVAETGEVGQVAGEFLFTLASGGELVLGGSSGV